MILVAFRHGLRAAEVCDLRWDQIDFSGAVLHVRRVNQIMEVHPGSESQGFDFVDDLSNFQIPRQKAMVGVLCWSELQFADLGHEETPDWVRTVLMSKEPGGRRRWPWMAHPMC